MSGPAHGTAVLNPNGSFTYTPAVGFAGTDSFTYKVNDGSLDSNPATVTVAVSSLPVPPVANNDSYTAIGGATLSVAAPGVLANDSAAPGKTLTAILVSGPAHGTAALNPNGSFTYTPAVGFAGTDSFTYKVNDGSLDSNLATVTVAVSSLPVPPVANNDSYTAIGGATLSVAAPGVLANDSAAPGKTLTAILVSGPAHGTAALNPNGSFTYTPAAGFAGTDSFIYKANDGSLDSNQATVTLAVTAAGVIFYDDFVRSTDPGPLSPWAAALGNWTVTGRVLQGSSATYAFAYVSAAWMDYSVQAQIRFGPGIYGGGLGGRLNSANGAHYAAWIYPETTPGNQALLRLVKFTDWWDFSTVQAVSIPAVGSAWHTLELSFQGTQITVSLDGSSLVNVIDSGVGAFASGGISADLWAGTAASFSLANVIASGSLIAPVANNDSYNVAAGTPLSVAAPGVLTNDSAAPGKPLTAILISGPAHGTAALNPNGSFTYTPAAGFSGIDSFTYKANDGSLDSNPATVTLAVSAPVAPAATDDSYNAIAGTPLSVAAPGVLANDSAAPGKTLTAILVSGPAHGTLALNPSGSFTYTPATGFAGTDSFIYKANDGSLDSNQATVTLGVTSAGVIFYDDFVRSTDPGPLTPWAAALGNWTVTGRALQGSSATYGFAYVSGAWTNYSVQGQIRFGPGIYGGGLGGRLNAANGAHYAAWIYPETYPGNQALLRLVKFTDWWDFSTVQAVNIPAVGSAWHTLELSFQGSQISVSLDGSSLVNIVDTRIGGVGAYGAGGISADLWAGTTASFSLANVVVSDLLIAPVAKNDTYTVRSATKLTVAAPGLLANDTVSSGKTLTAVRVSGPAHGTLTLNADGSFTYTSVAGFVGKDTFTYKANDGTLDSNAATVTVTVTAS